MAGALIAAGCADTRISLDELTRMQVEATQVEPAELTASELALTELRPYQVGPGDVLQATLTGLESQFGQTRLQLRVHDDGTVLLPMVGKVNVAGLDLKQVEAAIYDAHVPKFVKDMSIFIELGGPETTTVVVIGAAGNSGLVRLPSNERNLIYALGHAAAFSPISSGRVSVRPVSAGAPAGGLQPDRRQRPAAGAVSAPIGVGRHDRGRAGGSQRCLRNRTRERANAGTGPQTWNALTDADDLRLGWIGGLSGTRRGGRSGASCPAENRYVSSWR